MSIELAVNLTTHEKSLLAGIMNCNEEELDIRLTGLASAALEEYIRMILGQKVFTRGSDYREYRLFLLIKEQFNNRIPDEQIVSDLFQTTYTESKSLIKSVMAKYQYELKDAIHGTLLELFQDRIRQDTETNNFTLSNLSENKIDEFNRILGTYDGTLPQITKKRSTVATYEIKNSSYRKLCEHFRIAPVERDIQE